MRERIPTASILLIGGAFIGVKLVHLFDWANHWMQKPTERLKG